MHLHSWWHPFAAVLLYWAMFEWLGLVVNSKYTVSTKTCSTPFLLYIHQHVGHRLSQPMFHLVKAPISIHPKNTCQHYCDLHLLEKKEELRGAFYQLMRVDNYVLETPLDNTINPPLTYLWAAEQHDLEAIINLSHAVTFLSAVLYGSVPRGKILNIW